MGGGRSPSVSFVMYAVGRTHIPQGRPSVDDRVNAPDAALFPRDRAHSCFAKRASAAAARSRIERSDRLGEKEIT